MYVSTNCPYLIRVADEEISLLRRTLALQEQRNADLASALQHLTQTGNTTGARRRQGTAIYCIIFKIDTDALL